MVHWSFAIKLGLLAINVWVVLSTEGLKRAPISWLLCSMLRLGVKNACNANDKPASWVHHPPAGSVTRFTWRRVQELKNAQNSVTVQNRKHVYENFFDHKDLGNHLLQYIYIYIYIYTYIYKYMINSSHR